MEKNLSENSMVSEQNNVLRYSYNQAGKINTDDIFRFEKLSPDESFKRKSDFEREAIPHMDTLYYYAIKMSENRSDADELFRETYARAFRFFYKFEEGSNCKEWLCRIMRNCYINKYRKDHYRV